MQQLNLVIHANLKISQEVFGILIWNNQDVLKKEMQHYFKNAIYTILYSTTSH